MGWTWYHCAARKRNGKPDVKAECDGMLNHGERTRVLKSTMVGSTYYAAVQDNSDDSVWAAIFHTSVNSRDYYDFGYKDMDETMGPYQYNCPDSILDLLTPTDSEWARQWRDRCRKHNRQEREWASIPDGARYIWTVPSDQFKHLSKGDKVTIYKRSLNPFRKRSKKVWIIEQNGCYLDRRFVDRDLLERAAA